MGFGADLFPTYGSPTSPPILHADHLFMNPRLTYLISAFSPYPRLSFFAGVPRMHPLHDQVRTAGRSTCINPSQLPVPEHEAASWGPRGPNARACTGSFERPTNEPVGSSVLSRASCPQRAGSNSRSAILSRAADTLCTAKSADRRGSPCRIRDAHGRFPVF